MLSSDGSLQPSRHPRPHAILAVLAFAAEELTLLHSSLTVTFRIWSAGLQPAASGMPAAALQGWIFKLGRFRPHAKQSSTARPFDLRSG